MEKKNDQIFGFDYPDLDLSDDQQPNKQTHDKQPTGEPVKKNKIDESIQKNNQAQNKSNQIQKGPSAQIPGDKLQLPFFPPPPPGTNNRPASSWMPTPPVSVKTTPYVQQNRPQYQKAPYTQNRDNKQKKNTVYLKNIPKSFNTQEKLMTFFKNEGVIKQIKVNESDQSAVIKFLKQQNAGKFLKSNKIIFNRSYIVYGERENLTVSEQQIKDRVNDEQGNVKKAEQTNLKVLRQKAGNDTSQKIRALYFLQNYLVSDEEQITDQLRKQILSELQAKIEIKKDLQTQGHQKFKPEDFTQNQYCWTLNFVRKSASSIDRKNLFPQFLRYGPIINLESELISEQNQPKSSEKPEDLQQKPSASYEYRIKLLFLSIKHAWTLYCTKKEETTFTVEGSQVHKIFSSGKLKPIQLIINPDIDPQIVSKQVTICQESQKPLEETKPTVVDFSSGLTKEQANE